MSRTLRSIFFLSVFLLPPHATGETTPRKGKIHGESHVNLRSGADTAHPSSGVLKQGEEVIVEGEAGRWYIVALADGRKGYVHKTLVLLAPAAKQIPPPEKPQPSAKPPEAREKKAEAVLPSSAPIKEKKIEASTPAVKAVKETEPRGKHQPIIKVIEGKERDILGWLAVGLCIFIVGWICGGNYYLRRDQAKRKKLRF